MAYFSVRYYTKKGSNKSSRQLSGQINSQSETLVMQKLRNMHKGYDIELRELKWK